MNDIEFSLRSTAVTNPDGSVDRALMVTVNGPIADVIKMMIVAVRQHPEIEAMMKTALQLKETKEIKVTSGTALSNLLKKK